MSETGALPLDVLIVGRGGGSLEDLWAFNEEIVARALFAATVPIVSAVGHEVDFSIADLAADSRAATPSAAAEMISNDQNELLQHLDLLTASMTRSVKRQLDDTRQRLASLSRRVRHPGHALGQQRATLDRLSAALSRGIARQLADSKAQVARLSARVKTQHPRQQLNRHQLTSQQLQHQLRQRIDRRLTATRAELNHQSKLLASLGPEQTLSRGYAIVTDEQGKVVRQAASTDKGDQVWLRLGSGVLSAEITGHPTE
jgi:exodeoxyribonuclease VII large subunit